MAMKSDGAARRAHGARALPALDAAGAHDFTQGGRVVNAVFDLDDRRILAGLMEALKSHPVEKLP